RFSKDVARLVDDHGTTGAESIVASSEIIENGLAARRQREDHPAAVARTNPAVSACDGRADEVAACVKRQAAVGILAIAPAGEAVQHALLPLTVTERLQLEDRAAIVHAAGDRRAVRVALLIEDQSRRRFAAVIAAAEVVEHVIIHVGGRRARRERRRRRAYGDRAEE